jgi:hypothetical protein
MGVAAHLRARLSYGAPLWHFAGHAAAFAVIAYALSRLLQPSVGRPLSIVVWLVGGAVLHDLVLLPLYSLADRVARSVSGRAINYVRVPAVLSGVLLLVYFPLILGKAPAAYERNTGHAPPDYLARWLAITAALFAASAAAGFARRRRRSP